MASPPFESGAATITNLDKVRNSPIPAIHPSQVALANEVFSPSDAEVTKAKRILAAIAEAAKAGKGAVSLDGRLIDYASIRQAEVLVKKAEQIGGAS